MSQTFDVSSFRALISGIRVFLRLICIGQITRLDLVLRSLKAEASPPGSAPGRPAGAQRRGPARSTGRPARRSASASRSGSRSRSGSQSGFRSEPRSACRGWNSPRGPHSSRPAGDPAGLGLAAAEGGPESSFAQGGPCESADLRRGREGWWVAWRDGGRRREGRRERRREGGRVGGGGGAGEGKRKRRTDGRREGRRDGRKEGRR